MEYKPHLYLKEPFFAASSAPELLCSSAETLPALLHQPIMMELYLATVTSPALQGPLVIRLEDSVPAGSMLSVVSAQSVLRDTTASPTADVSEWFLLPALVST